MTLLATGSSKMKKKFKLFGVKNWFISDDIFDRIPLKQRLKNSKRIMIRSLNMESLEMASLLASKFPEKTILIQDPERSTSLHHTLGDLVAGQMIQYFKEEKGVRFNLGRCIRDVYEKDNGNILVHLSPRKRGEKASKLLVDMVIDADNLVIANNKLLKTE
jgi:pyruvate/2-oxoglutarate dehydrogenase complex dihydrolipoamide dehydrogenase (E3) component